MRVGESEDRNYCRCRNFVFFFYSWRKESFSLEGRGGCLGLGVCSRVLRMGGCGGGYVCVWGFFLCWFGMYCCFLFFVVLRVCLFLFRGCLGR